MSDAPTPAPSPDLPPDPAIARFWIIQLVRLGGLVLTFAGLSVLAGKVALPSLAGLTITLTGLFAALFAPIMLARRWKTPRS